MTNLESEMTPTQRIIELADARKNGTGWRARCPAHDDRNPSLSITEGDDGRALLHCHAGCSIEAIAAALGLKLSDLMPAKPHGGNGRLSAPKPAQARVAVRTFPSAAEAVAALERQHGKRAAAWTYRNAKGEPVGLVVRWNLPNNEKDIRPVSKTPTGWIIGAMAAPRPLYGLPELLKSPKDSRVYVCEGEKSADAAGSLGLLATTSAGGAKAAGKTDWLPLAGREVVILPDRDEPGERYAQDVSAILRGLNPPATVRVVRLVDGWPDLPAGGDIADVAAGEDVDAIKTKLAGLVDAAEPETPDAPPPAVERFKPFPVEALPAALRGFVLELAAATANDPACAALAALAVLAAAIGNRAAVQVKRGWFEPSVLWAAIVARSGTTKSAVLKLAVRPLIESYKQDRERYAEALGEYQAERARYEIERDRWKAAQKRGVGATDPPVEPEAPAERRLLVSDVTCEKLGVLLQENPMGLLLSRDELAAWVGAFDRYAAGGKGSDGPTWLSFFDAAPVVIDRKSAAGTIFVERAAVSVLGSIQPGTLRRVFGEAERESGLLARLLMVQPPTRPALWTDEELSDATAAAWADLLRGLMSIQPGTDDQGEPRPRLLQLSVDAKPIYKAWHNAHALETADVQDDDLAAHFAKLKGTCLRVALLLTCVDAVTTGQAVAFIGRDHIEQAIVIIDWFKGEARRVYGAMVESEEARDRRRLADWIGVKGGSVTVRDLTHGARAYRGRADAAERALAGLVEAGIGQWEAAAPSPKGGRPARRFQLVTGVTVTETPRHGSATRGYGDGDTVDAPKTDADGADDWGEV